MEHIHELPPPKNIIISSETEPIRDVVWDSFLTRKKLEYSIIYTFFCGQIDFG